MSQCKQCGAQLDAGVKVCPQCGSVLEGNLVANEQYDSNLSREMDESKRKEQQRKRKIISRLGAVGWVGFIIIVAIIVAPIVSDLNGAYEYLLSVNLNQICALSIFATILLCFCACFNGGSIAAIIVSVNWAFAVSFVAATLHYANLGYSAASAGKTWEYFGTQLLIFAVAIVVSTLVGRAVAKSTNSH